MLKKYLFYGFLLSSIVCSVYFFQTSRILSESKVLQIAYKNPSVQQWMNTQSSRNGQRTPLILMKNHAEEVQVKSTINKEKEKWAITLQSNSGQQPMNLSVTIDDKTGEVTSIKEENRVIILFENEVNIDKIKESDGKILEITNELPMVTATMSPNDMNDLEKDPNILTVEKDQIISIQQQRTDWGIEKINTQPSWHSNLTGKGVKVAVIDSGIDLNHQDLDVAGGESFVSYTSSYHDDNGHGTHVAGIIGALNNTFGTVGVAYDASVYAVKVLDSEGLGYLSDIITGINWAIENDMDMINLSLGSNQHSEALKYVVDKAYQHGILVVSSSGNFGGSMSIDNVGYPARYESVIAVGAIDTNLNLADFSSTGKALEVVAPGVDILSTYSGNQYNKISGTSMAAPYVTGNLALLKQANPTATVKDLRTLLQKNALDLGHLGRDTLYGHGFIQSSSNYSIHGRNRYETSVMISQNGWKDGSNNVLLGRGDLPIDALTGSTLARKLDAPILLTDPKTIPIEVLTEIKRLDPEHIILLGGESAISAYIKDQLERLGYKVDRLSGSNRYDTAIQVAKEVISQNEIFLTTGEHSSDPLSIAPYAGLISAPILLTGKASLAEEAKKFLAEHAIEEVTIVGGEAVVSKEINRQLESLGIRNIQRISGENRYATSANIVKMYQHVLTGPIFIASGTSFVDALPGASLATKNKSPIILVQQDDIPKPIKDLLQQTYTELPQLRFLGGYKVIGIETRTSLERILNK